MWGLRYGESLFALRIETLSGGKRFRLCCTGLRITESLLAFAGRCDTESPSCRRVLTLVVRAEAGVEHASRKRREMPLLVAGLGSCTVDWDGTVQHHTPSLASLDCSPC
jgi:hypothetical protein